MAHVCMCTYVLLAMEANSNAQLFVHISDVDGLQLIVNKIQMRSDMIVLMLTVVVLA